MNELIHEIEEDIRRERFDKLWHSFGKVMVYASIGIVVATIAYVVAHNRRQEASMEKTAAFIKGVDRIALEDYKGAIPIFDELAVNQSSYGSLALMRKAQAQKGLLNNADAQKTYEQLSTHNDAFGQLGGMMAGKEMGEAKKDSAFYYTQREYNGWQYLAQGKKEEAATEFLALYNDTMTPNTLRARAYETLQHVAPEKLAAATPSGETPNE